MKYDKEFKLQALELADEIGVKVTAEQLGIKYYTPLSEKDRRIKELEAELRETRRANDILKEALGIFAQSRKK